MDFRTETERNNEADDRDRMWSAWPRPCGEVEKTMSEITMSDYDPGLINPECDVVESVRYHVEKANGHWREGMERFEAAQTEKDREIEQLRNANKLLGETINSQGRQLLDAQKSKPSELSILAIELQKENADLKIRVAHYEDIIEATLDNLEAVLNPSPKAEKHSVGLCDSCANASTCTEPPHIGFVKTCRAHETTNKEVSHEDSRE